MDREPSFLDDLERSLVDGVGYNIRRAQRRRRLAVVGVSMVILIAGVAGLAAVRGDGSSDGVASPATTPGPTEGAPATPAEPAPSMTVSTTTSSNQSTTSTTSTTTTTTTTPNVEPVDTRTTTTTRPPCTGEKPDGDDQFPLQRCNNGWGVVWVRLALIEQGDLIDDGSVSADFTDAVDAAVRRFQTRKGLEVDGLVGPRTWFALYPEFHEATGLLTEYDLNGTGQIEPFEVGAMGDANAPCDDVPNPDCPPETAAP